MELWMIMAMTGAVAQAVRTAGQKWLTAEAGPIGASFSRFIFATPFSWLWLWIWQLHTSQSLPPIAPTFWFWVIFGGSLQIIFTVALVQLLRLRNFAAGVAFSKTEVLQAAIFEAILVGYIASFHVGLAIIIGIVAVLLLSSKKGDIGFFGILRSVGTGAGLLGLVSGACLGAATVSYGIASDYLASEDPILRASVTAAITCTIQTIIMGALMMKWTPTQLRASIVQWRPGVVIGIFSSLSTITWFVAFAIYYVGPARAIGQIELVASILLSALLFKEKISRTEYIAIALLSLSVLIILLT